MGQGLVSRSEPQRIFPGMENASEGRCQRGTFPRDEYLTLWDRDQHVLTVPCSAKGQVPQPSLPVYG